MFLPTSLVIICGVSLLNVGATSNENEGERNSNEAIAIGKRDINDIPSFSQAIQNSLQAVNVTLPCLTKDCGDFKMKKYLCPAISDKPNVANFQAILDLLKNCLVFCGYGLQFPLVTTSFTIPLPTAVNTYKCIIQGDSFQISTENQKFSVKAKLSDNQACYDVIHEYQLRGEGLLVNCESIPGCPGQTPPFSIAKVTLSISVKVEYSVCVYNLNGARTVFVTLATVNVIYTPKLDLLPSIKQSIEASVNLFLQNCLISQAIIEGNAYVIQQLLQARFSSNCL